jgi:hypothetical protein
MNVQDVWGRSILKALISCFIIICFALFFSSCRKNTDEGDNLYVLDKNLSIPVFPSENVADLFAVEGGLALSDSTGLLSFIYGLSGKQLFRMPDKYPDAFILTGYLTKNYCDDKNWYYDPASKVKGCTILQYHEGKSNENRWEVIDFITQRYDRGMIENSNWWIYNSEEEITRRIYTFGVDTHIEKVYPDDVLDKNWLASIPLLSLPLNIDKFDAAKAPKIILPGKYQWDAGNLYHDWYSVSIFGKVPCEEADFTAILYTVTPYKERNKINKNCDLWLALFDKQDRKCSFREETDFSDRQKIVKKDKLLLRGNAFLSEQNVTGVVEDEGDGWNEVHLSRVILTGKDQNFFSYTMEVQQEALEKSQLHSVYDEINRTLPQSWKYENTFGNLAGEHNVYPLYYHYNENCFRMTYRNDALNEEFVSDILQSLSEPMNYIQPLACIPYAYRIPLEPLLLFAYWYSSGDGQAVRLYVVDKELRVKALRELYADYRTQASMEADHPMRQRSRFTEDELAGFNYENHPFEIPVIDGQIQLIIKNDTILLNKYIYQNGFSIEF